MICLTVGDSVNLWLEADESRRDEICTVTIGAENGATVQCVRADWDNLSLRFRCAWNTEGMPPGAYRVAFEVGHETRYQAFRLVAGALLFPPSSEDLIETRDDLIEILSRHA